LVGSLLLILTFFIHAFFNGMMGMMGGFGYMTFFPMFFGIPALVLGIVGSLIDREAGGILLLIAAFLSLPAFFGFFGISSVLLLLAGIFALTKRN